jgi:tryptophan-rich hypothetical protein|tara:strand:- start:346 stop:564 length:219 start_codon:yes stop_codon:yes gene_type:complete
VNKINSKKLRNSKWTALKPTHKEKHFLITEVEYDEEGNVIECILEAVMTKREQAIDWRDLSDDTIWAQGWKY